MQGTSARRTLKQTNVARRPDKAKVEHSGRAVICTLTVNCFLFRMCFCAMWVCLSGWIMLLPGKHMACRGHLPQLKWHTPAHKARHVSISSFHMDTRHINKTKQRQMVETGNPSGVCVCSLYAIRRLVFGLVTTKEANNRYYILSVLCIFWLNGKFLMSALCKYVCTRFLLCEKSAVLKICLWTTP